MADFDQLSNHIEEQLKQTGVPAFALGILRGDELIYERGFGHVIQGRQASDILFPTCSTSKPITATLVMKLVEAGQLELDAPVIDYLPWLRYPDGGDVSAVNLRHLLSHTSGISSDPDFPECFFSSDSACLKQHLEQDIPAYHCAGVPGEVFWYSNSGFNIAGHLAEKVTGMPFAQLSKDMLFDPLGMVSTSFDPNGILGHEGMEVIEALHATQRPPIPYPAGGSVTTVRDLAKFAKLHMNQGMGPRGRFLEAPTLDRMHEIHADAYSRQPRWYGLGFDIEFHRGRKLVTHGGGGFGCGTTFAMVPAEKVAIIALFNHPAGYAISSRYLLDQILDDKSEDAEPGKVNHELWPDHVGRYRSAWPNFEGYPNEIVVEEKSEELHVQIDGHTSTLECHDDPVYLTHDGRSSVGFVPGGSFLMFDCYGIGLVSAWPYKKV